MGAENINFYVLLVTALSVIGGLITIAKWLRSTTDRAKKEAAQLTRIEVSVENVKEVVDDTHKRLDSLEEEMSKSKEWRDKNSGEFESLVRFKCEQRQINKETNEILNNYKDILEDTNEKVELLRIQQNSYINNK